MKTIDIANSIIAGVENVTKDWARQRKAEERHDKTDYLSPINTGGGHDPCDVQGMFCHVCGTFAQPGVPMAAKVRHDEAESAR